LIHAVSFDKEALDITICHLHPDLELVSPVYCSNGTVCRVSPSQRIDTGDTMKASFGIGSKQGTFKGVLLYKLRRKYTTKAGRQSNNTASIEDTAANIYLLIIWDVQYSCHIFRACLLEYTDHFTRDEDKLWALHYEYMDRIYECYNYIEIPWLMNDGIVIKTELDVTYRSNCRLDVVISEGSGKYNMYKPAKINPERLVLSLLMLIVLMCAASFSIGPLFKLSIYNQCSNFDLVFPIYAAGTELECCRPPEYKVCAGSLMKSTFIVGSDDVSICGALIYKLQRKQTHESIEFGKDTSNSVYLLVVWRTFKSKLDADVLLVGHDKEFDWNKDSLIDLFNKNSRRFKWYHLIAIEKWSLNDNTASSTTLWIKNEDRTLDIIISEVERGDSAKIPAHVDLER
jgi:hypothetical protein